MSRNTTDDDTNVIPLPPHGRPPAKAQLDGEQLPCLWCNAPTLRVTLATFGARCVACYRAYCGEPQPAPRFMADKRTGGPKAWAHALKARDESGERLTPAQRESWRAAICGRAPEPFVDEQGETA